MGVKFADARCIIGTLDVAKFLECDSRILTDNVVAVALGLSQSPQLAGKFFTFPFHVGVNLHVMHARDMSCRRCVTGHSCLRLVFLCCIHSD